MRRFISLWNNKKLANTAAILFWIAAWHIISLAVGHRLLLASPLDTLTALAVLLRSGAFYAALLQSLGRIAEGFLLGLTAAVGLSSLAARRGWIRALFHPVMQAARAIPVASFVIVVLIWADSDQLSVVISFLMVCPVLYESLLTGFLQRDPRMEELAEVYAISSGRRFRAITLPQLAPHLRAGLTVAMGLCWKAGIAAEVIGQPKGSIGSSLYQAKVYLETPELFAWTVCIVLLSAALERIALKICDWAIARVIRIV